MKKFLTILALMILARAACAGEAAAALYDQGNAAFRAGSFQPAVALYEKAAAAGINNSDLYYNLGNAYYKAGDRGRAALYWQRAEKLNPNAPDLRANLELLEKQVSESLAIPEKKMPTDFLRRLRDLGPAKKWGMVLSVSIWGFWVLLFLFLMARRRPVRRVLLLFNIIFILIMIFAGFGFGFRYSRELEPAGVVVAQTVSVRSVPGESFNSQFELPAGARILIRECGNGYCKIELPPGMVGWVDEKTVVKI